MDEGTEATRQVPGSVDFSAPLKQYDARREEREKADPQTLFHYTSASSFLQILRNRTLRLGRLSAMNDAKEHSWLREIAHRLAASRFRKAMDRSARSDDPYVVFYDRIRTFLDGPILCDPYCVCFSTRGDLLSQWRAYAQDASGFAIGFSRKAIEQGLGTERNPVKVRYDAREQVAIVRRILRFYEPLIDETGARKDQAVRLAFAVYLDVIRAAMFCKNGHFAEEREFRLINDEEPDEDAVDALLKWRIHRAPVTSVFVEREAHILHFLEMDLSKVNEPRPITKIVLGPKNPARTRPEALRKFLFENGYEHLLNEIYQSAGTLR